MKTLIVLLALVSFFGCATDMRVSCNSEDVIKGHCRHPQFNK